MTLEAKGTIKLEERGIGADGKTFSTFSVRAPTLGIDEGLPKTITSTDAAVLALQEMIRTKVQDDFKRPIEITLGGESISCTYFIDPINNRTLDEFTREHPTDDDDTKITITGPDGKSVETTPKRVALAAKVMEKSRETGIPPEEILAAAKKKAAKGGAGE